MQTLLCMGCVGELRGEGGGRGSSPRGAFGSDPEADQRFSDDFDALV